MLKIISALGITFGSFIGYLYLADLSQKNQWRRLFEQIKRIEERDPNRYTTEEIKSIVGNSKNNEWTDEQVERLMKLYEKRVEIVNEYDIKRNEKYQRYISKLPEKDKPKGILQLIAYGCPDTYYTGPAIFTDQTQIGNNYYKNVYESMNRDK